MSSVDTVVSRAWELLKGPAAALVSDIDGTISRIAPTPDEAFVGEPARSALRAILPHLALTAIVTGRESAVAQSMVGVEGLTYVGSYALEGAAAAVIDPEKLLGARNEVAARLGALPCVRVEDKDISFALHYRDCEDRREARLSLLDITSPIAASCGAKIIEGKQVIEIVPASLPGKDTAVRHLVAQRGIQSIVFFGDDLGDVAVFRELARMRDADGLQTLAVGVIDAETDDLVFQDTDVTLNGVDEVEDVLAALAARFAGGAE